MRRFSIFTLCLMMMLSLFIIPTSAYVFTDDPISDPNEYRLMRKMEAQILNNTTMPANISSDAPSLQLDQAVRTYIFTPEEFLSQVQDGTVTRPGEDASYSWEVPIYFDEETGAYKQTSFGYLSNGSFEYITYSAPSNEYNDRQYLFHPEETLSLLYSAGISENADIYVFSLSNVSVDFVIAEEDGNFWVVPYASRPDFLDLKNGTVMTLDAFAEKLDAYMNETSGGGPLSGGGGGGGRMSFDISSISPLWWLAGGFLLCVAVYCFWCYSPKKSKNSDHSTS